MPIRKPVITERKVRDIGKRRIRIPQPIERPIRILQKKGIPREKYQPEYWWFVEHRRGVHRPLVGEDPLEARAVQNIRGTLPERIVYRWLTAMLRMSPITDFSFQSSLQGGRMELGGIVADFMFPYLGIIIQVQGPTHTQYLRAAKDKEQVMDLADMGYTVYEISDDEVYDVQKLEDRMRRMFNITPGRNFFGYNSNPVGDAEGNLNPEMMDRIYRVLEAIDSRLLSYLVSGISAR